MFGAIVGDIIGKPYEFNNIKTTDFPLFTEKSGFTDDTVCTAAVASAILDGNYDYRLYLRNLCPLYRTAGYGKKFADWLSGVDDAPYNSWGNGSAMRVSPIGWLYSADSKIEDLNKTLAEAKKSAEPTHNSPEGIRGAEAVAGAIHLARKKWHKKDIKSWIHAHTNYNLNRTCDEIRPSYRFDVSCEGSVPQAIIAFLDSTDFESAIRLAVSIGGDTDTIAAITGSIAEAYYGKVPDDIAKEAVARLDDRLRNILLGFIDKYY